MRSQHGGFTLLEVLMVVAVIALLALIIIPSIRTVSTRAREDALKTNLRSMRQAIAVFQQDVGGLPLTLDQLILSREDAIDTLPQTDAAGTPMTPVKYKGPYLVPDRIPRDFFSADGTWEYNPVTGDVRSSSTRPALDGTVYAGW